MNYKRQSIGSKLKVVVLAGARSTEHEVSLLSASNIVKSINRDLYEVFVIGIDKQGIWRLYNADSFAEHSDDIAKVTLGQPISGRLAVTQSSNKFYDIDSGGQVVAECDVVFPAVLGSYAEDGTMQGLLRMMDVPFTTPDVLGSAVGMDKDIAYRLLAGSGLNVARFVVLRKGSIVPTYDSLSKQLKAATLFIKPANAGSSVGVSRVTNESELRQALDKSFRYDVKTIIQAAVIGREVEISVMGNFGAQQASVVGEIIEKKPGDFYSYENKYVHSSNVELVAPAKFDGQLLADIRQAALKVCDVLECEGFGRVDFFIDASHRIYVNEINTMPGFTAISMFPRLWAESGVAYPELLDRLLRLAVERHAYRVAPIVTDAQDVISSID